MNNSTDQEKPIHIWEGVYPDLSSANLNAIGPGFRGEVYRRKSLEVAQECLNALKRGESIPTFHKQRSTYLPVVVAMMLQGTSKVKVLDFGGGFGIGFMTLVENIRPYLSRVDYTILEVQEVCESGNRLHDGTINYTSSISGLDGFDLVHAASSLQYIENWHDLVEIFASVGPKYILLSDVFAGNIKTYATLQNYYGSKIPHWFLNLDDLLNRFEGYGYELIYKSPVSSRRLGVEDLLPMGNFPKNFQLNQSLHLLFKKNEK
jgi:putative methyltransferase (TIGR04325 family)